MKIKETMMVQGVPLKTIWALKPGAFSSFKPKPNKNHKIPTQF